MTNRITAPEWEALSAYLDNQTSSKDRAKLEARLKSDPEMRRALEELSRTRLILRGQRPLRAPRNFTLTPAMAGSRRPGIHTVPTQFSVFRMASILATLFLVLITIGDLAVRRFAPAPTTIALSEPMEVARGMGGGGGGPGVAPITQEAVAQAEMEAELAVPPEEPAAMAIQVTPVSSPDADAELEALKQSGEPAQESANSISPGSEVLQPVPARSPITWIIRLLQGLLAVLAVGAGIAALILRRSTS